jgi:hypothetical protein
MVPSMDDHANRQLIQQLMLHGWYRLGQGPPNDQGRKTWGFREGHLLDTSGENTCWIAAPDELSAMRTLMATLEDDVASRAKHRVTVARDTPPDENQLDRHHTASASGLARSNMLRH